MITSRPQWLVDSERPLDWNGPTGRAFVPFGAADLNLPLVSHLERAVRRYPNRIAVSDAQIALTYTRLWHGLSDLAETITAQTRAGELVAIRMPTCSLSVVAMLACLATGRPFVVLDGHSPDSWLTQVLQDARPALVLECTSATRVPAVGWQPAQTGLDQPACVTFTSGSTGRPKGIVNSQRNLLQRVAQSINAAHINAEDRFLTLAPLATIVGVRDVITALVAGAGTHLVDVQQLSPHEITSTIRGEAITILFAFPALLRELIAHARKAATPTLRLVRIGGDTTLWSDVKLLRNWLAPKANIQVIYAATEAPMMQWFVHDTCQAKDARTPIGYPLPGNRLAIVDESGCDTPAGDAGELIVESPYVSLGQWVDGRCVMDEPADAARGQRIFRTGDLVRLRPDGLLERLGRKDRQVKIRGQRVELEAVEASLRQHSLVRDVGVVARASWTDGNPTLVAYIKAAGRSSALLDELKAMMHSAPPVMRPTRFYLVDEVPRLPSSKLDVRALLALDESHAKQEHNHAARTMTRCWIDEDRLASTVAGAWERALMTPVRSPDDDFFELGGDSLRAIALLSDLERALGTELSLSLISEAPKFGQLCTALEALREQRTTRYAPLVLLKSGDASPPLYLVHGAGGDVAELFPLARSMTYPGPVFGIHARGFVRGESPHTSVEAMAVEYLREIKARQPDGPYHLGGYSLGGLVAFEMALRLRERGDQVGLVGLFDSLPAALRWPLNRWPAWIRRRIGRLAKAVAPTRVLKVAASALLASARYRPGFYPGEIHLFVPTERDPAVPSPQGFWCRHARTVLTISTPGRHLTMLAAPHAQSAAASVTRCLPVSCGAAAV